MISLNSYAKLNIGLEILDERKDGFHDISTIITKIDLSDQIYFDLSDENKVIQKGIKEKNNIVHKVLMYMLEKYNSRQKVNINIIKNIPYSSGMGGGSSNAAVAIEGINQILSLNLDSKEKFDIGLRFGSDIPFFLSNSTAKVTGRGDKISFIKSPNMKNIVIFHPKYELLNKTQKVFKNNSIFTDGKNQKKILNEINNNIKIKGPIFNGLEKSALDIFENLDNIKKKLISLGANNLSMTGAGPTFYSIQNSLHEADTLKKIVDNSNLNLLTINTRIL